MISFKKSGEKRSKVESNLVEKKSLKRKLVASSDYEYDVEADVLDIMPSSRNKFGGRKIHVNVPAARLDNISFHIEGNV